MAKAPTKTEPKFQRGDLVRVEEENLKPWEGTVGYPKWSPVSGWNVEVHRKDVGTYIFGESYLTLIERKES